MAHGTLAIKYEDLEDALCRGGGDLDLLYEITGEDSETCDLERMSEKYAGSWWFCVWPEHVVSPKFNGDASYHGPCKSAAECEADVVFAA